MSASLDPAIIKGLSIFDGLDDAARSEVLFGEASKRYPAGQPVFEQGAAATQFFVLLYGRLRVTQVTAEGQQMIVRMVNPGDLFGIAKALRRPDYPGTATAVTESLADRIPAGTRSVSIFLVNRRPSLDEELDRAYADEEVRS